MSTVTFSVNGCEKAKLESVTSLRWIWNFVRAVRPHTDTLALYPRAEDYSSPLFSCPSLPPPLSPSLSIRLTLSFTARIRVSAFFPGPLVRLMDDGAGREWQWINYPAASLILIWLSGSSGWAEGRLGHRLTCPGSSTNNSLGCNLKAAQASVSVWLAWAAQETRFMVKTFNIWR